MSLNVNEVRVGGRIGGKLELKYTPAGTPVLNFSVATNRKYKENGILAERTEWHRLTVFGDTAAYLASNASSGTEVYVEGELRTRKWVDKATGGNREKTEIYVYWVDLTGKPASGEVELPETHATLDENEP